MALRVFVTWNKTLAALVRIDVRVSVVHSKAPPPEQALSCASSAPLKILYLLTLSCWIIAVVEVKETAANAGTGVAFRRVVFCQHARACTHLLVDRSCSSASLHAPHANKHHGAADSAPPC